MKITDVKVTTLYSRRESGTCSPHAILQLATDEGLVGIGEMSDLGHGRTKWDVADLEESIAHVLVGKDPLAWGSLTREVRGWFGKAGALGEGIEIAILDLVGKAKDQSIADIFGGAQRDRIRVCYPIFRMFDMAEVEPNLAHVDKFMAMGHNLYRLYCGGNLKADESFLSQVRDKWGDRFELKSLDLSGRLPWKKSMEVLDRLLPYEPLLAESVCDRRDLAGQAEVRGRVDVPISEHISSVEQAFLFAQNRYVDIFNVSLAGAGGFTTALRIAHIAEAAGISCLVGTTQELSIGVAAQAMFGSVLENLDYPSDITGGLLYRDDVVKDRVQYKDSYLLVPDGPGVGMVLDQDKLASLERPLSSLPVAPW